MPNVTIIKYMMVLPLFLIKKHVGNQINENWIRYHLENEPKLFIDIGSGSKLNKLRFILSAIVKTIAFAVILDDLSSNLKAFILHSPL